MVELDRGYHMLLYENETQMGYAVAATAWGHLIGCPAMNDEVFDALRAFRDAYLDKGPRSRAVIRSPAPRTRSPTASRNCASTRPHGIAEWSDGSAAISRTLDSGASSLTGDSEGQEGRRHRAHAAPHGQGTHRLHRAHRLAVTLQMTFTPTGIKAAKPRTKKVTRPNERPAIP